VTQQPTKTVLVVDDNEGVRETLALLLEMTGYRVETAIHGREALDYLHTNPAPSLILLDLRMPVMSGVEFRSEQRRSPDLAKIPVIVCSAEVKASDNADLHGVAAFCAKPADPQKLLGLVATHSV